MPRPDEDTTVILKMKQHSGLSLFQKSKQLHQLLLRQRLQKKSLRKITLCLFLLVRIVFFSSIARPLVPKHHKGNIFVNPTTHVFVTHVFALCVQHTFYTMCNTRFLQHTCVLKTCVTHISSKHVSRKRVLPENVCCENVCSNSENVCCENVCCENVVKTCVVMKTCVTTKTCVLKTCVSRLKTCVTKTCVVTIK